MVVRRNGLILAAAGAVVLCATTAHAAYDLTNVPWVAAVMGTDLDYVNDQQTGQSSADLVGTSTVPMLSWYFDRNASAQTPSATDGTLFLRARIGGKDKDSSWRFDNILMVGLDFSTSADPGGTGSFGDMDLFLMADVHTGNLGSVGVAGAGGDTNLSPSTTSIGGFTGTTYAANRTANGPYYSFGYTTDGIDVDTNQSTDGWVSFAIPFSTIVQAAGSAGINITDQTAFKFGVGTSTNANAFNEDIGGVDRTGMGTTWDWIYTDEGIPGGGVTLDSIGRASGAVTASTTNLGNVHLGTAFGTADLTVRNTATDPNAQRLDADVAGTTGDAINAGGTTIQDLIAGQSDTGTLRVGLDASVAGYRQGTITIALTSDGTAQGQGRTSVGNQVVTVSGNIYDGQSTWIGTAGGNWGGNTQLAATHSNWNATGGAPGIWAGYDNVDRATFGNSITSPTATIVVASPVSLNRITFDNTQGQSYTITRGAGSSLTLKSNSTYGAMLDDRNGNHTIIAPITLQSNLRVNVQNGGDRLSVAQLLQGGGGTQAVEKTGPGTLILTATSTYTGTTTISGGTLQVDGAIASAVDVQSLATLSGANGIINGSVTLRNGGTVSPGVGNSSSQLTTLGQVWQAGGTYDLDIARMGAAGLQSAAGVNYDTVVSSGSLDLSGLSSTSPAGKFNLVVDDQFSSGFDYKSDYQWEVATFAQGITYGAGYDSSNISSLFAVNLSLYDMQYEGDWRVSADDQSLYLNYVYSAVPEAGTVILGAAVVVPILSLRRRELQRNR